MNNQPYRFTTVGSKCTLVPYYLGLDPWWKRVAVGVCAAWCCLGRDCSGTDSNAAIGFVVVVVIVS